MCPPDSVLIVTDANALNGSGKKPSDVAFCIDRTELSNGDRPRGGLSAGAARSACKKAGRHICSNRQWLRACNNGAPDAAACNISGAVRKGGSAAGCATRDGVLDMIGNVGEWTAEGVIRGGDVGGGGSGCDYSTRRFSAKSTDGTRCCSDPEYKL